MDFTSLVIITVLGTVGSTEAKYVIHGTTPQFHPVVSGFLLGTLLFIGGLVSEDITRKICYLILVAALIMNGPDLFKALTPQTPAPTIAGPITH